MKIAYSLYELEANHSLSVTSSALKRQGVLLRVMFPLGQEGYADCHPWPELGDLPLQQQLEALKQGQLTPITQCALEFAHVDATARRQRQSILSPLHIPQSHFLVTYLFDLTSQHVQHLLQQGYTHLKLKLGYDVDREARLLHSLFSDSSLRLRLDFNETLTFSSCRAFLDQISHLQHQIEFIEDPFPFQEQEWAAIQGEGWTLACDRQVHRAYHQPESAQVLIIKPALQTTDEWKRDVKQTRIVTSYLGHPLGQLAAAYVASQIDPLCHSVHGLLSHHVYRPTIFSQALNWQNSQFVFPAGTGFGFQQELEQLTWIPL